MKIRVTGTREETAATVTVLRSVLDVHETSSWRAWTRHDPLSKVGAVYVTAELPIGGVPARP
ncbi:hypothetical protein [Actinosynnema mirum]|uniref:Uncharacterized protein n=1 Tax=Actinosynnema mirum (strain ATCC 29888 / DSM 43827 / JCM 3225 / NBRC 14064 / NCIMB 13271 / NRRL B-12336 / IMRU 3971 / 101) TaxID=446462 RepID=C6WBK2_ACTMD|nr:hypothetical protein [Actinosynnema mirum]ACU35570.1 hypothetical protein Amir_1621 [Actinosynnema mirum DSM 43827]